MSLKRIRDFAPGTLHATNTIILCLDEASGKFKLTRQAGTDVFDTPYFEALEPDKQDGFCEVSWESLLKVLGREVSWSKQITEKKSCVNC